MITQKPQIQESLLPSAYQIIHGQQDTTTTTTTTPIPASFSATDGDQIVRIMQLVGDMVMHCIIELDGTIQEKRLARAMRLSLDVEPVLGCTLKLHWWKPRWHRRSDLDEITLCTLEKTDDKETALQQFMIREIDPSRDPLVHAHVIRGTSDTVCLKISHIVADAGGTKQYAYLIASLYRQLTLQPQLKVEPRLHGSRSIWQLIKKFTWRQIFRMTALGIKDLYRQIFPMRYWNIPVPKVLPEQRKYAIRHISHELFQDITWFARKHNATINDVVISAYLRALHHLYNTPEWGPFRTINTVDLRRYLSDQETQRIFCLSSFTYPYFPGSLGKTLVDTVQQMNQSMNHIKANYIGMREVPFLGLMINLMPFALLRWSSLLMYQFMRYIMPPVLTNMGRVFPHQLDFGDTAVQNAFTTASVIYPPFFGGGFSGFGDNLTFSFGFCETGISQDQVDAILDQTLQELSACREFSTTTPT